MNSANEQAVHVMGQIAQARLVHSGPGAAWAVLGVTSRGIFLHRLAPEGGQVLFLSFEKYRGPLTLNLAAPLAAGAGLAASNLAVGDRVEVTRQGLFFPSIHTTLNIRAASVWQAPSPVAPDSAGEAPLPSLSGKEAGGGGLIERAFMLYQRAWANQPAGRQPGPLALYLPALCASLPAPPEPDPLWPRLSCILQQAGSLPEQTAALAAALGAWLGWGPGLTPSGDDLVLGFLLVVNRWGAHPLPGLDLTAGLDLGALNAALLAQAGRATTSLAADLIRCASLGQADERLVQAVDGLLSGAPPLATCAAGLATWGSSSGLDALVGMTLAIRRWASVFIRS